MRELPLCLFAVLLGMGGLWADSAAAPSKTAEPGLAYGNTAELPLPKTILFSASPEQIIADARAWAEHGVQAFFMDQVAREWSTDIWAADKKPWTIGASDETFQQAKQANDLCKRIGSETFLKIAFDHFFEWFNDTAWKRIQDNFRQFAIFARDSGCTGIALDIEYCGEQYRFDWPGYTYDGYSREALAKKVRDRMTAVMRTLYDEFPGMVLLTFPEQEFNLGMVIHLAWVEEAAARQAPGGVHYCTEYTYRNPNIRYMLGHAWACNSLFQHLLSPRAKAYWKSHCSIAPGIWPFGFDYQAVQEPGMPLEEFRQGYAAALMAGRRYNWIYSHNCYEQLLGRKLDLYAGPANLQDYLEVIARRAVVISPPYVDVAAELRGMTLRDYRKELGVAPVPRFVEPGALPDFGLIPANSLETAVTEQSWRLAVQYFHGEAVNLQKLFCAQTHWLVAGPFPSDETFSGHATAYPPEQGPTPAAEYDTVNGKGRWMEYAAPDDSMFVDFKSVFTPAERVCAYALCYVASEKERPAQLRVGTNDAGKVWLGGTLIYDYPAEGTAYLDRDVVPVTLPQGVTPLLVKVCNNQLNWGFVLRITDHQGKTLDHVRYLLSPTEP